MKRSFKWSFGNAKFEDSSGKRKHSILRYISSDTPQSINVGTNQKRHDSSHASFDSHFGINFFLLLVIFHRLYSEGRKKSTLACYVSVLPNILFLIRSFSYTVTKTKTI